jgi:hypothetical protein
MEGGRRVYDVVALLKKAIQEEVSIHGFEERDL